MGTLWCAHLPIVTVPRSDRPKAVTFVLPFYCNPHFLRRQIAGWRTYPIDLASSVTAIVVDDGSPGTSAAAVVAAGVRPFPIRVFRIEEDRRWNWLAARNIGLHHAPDGLVLVTDMDHVVPESTLRAVIYGQHDPNVIYGFSRREHTGDAIAPHCNSWFLTREMFWKVGGYDEALSGHYGTDGDWRRRCAATAPMQILRDELVRHEYQDDSSTSRYLRKQPEDAAVKRIVAARGRHWKPKTLSFPYHEVAMEAVCQ